MDGRDRDPTLRRDVLRAVGLGVAGTVGAVGTAGCLGGDRDLPEETPTGPVSTATLPTSPGEHTYATMGDTDAPVRAVYYGNWKCPYCADFSTGFMGDIVTDYVEPGDVRLTYRALAYVGGEPFLGADAPRAARAGLAVWNVDPGSYWRFHEYVMVNQPPETEQWATVDTLATMAENAGVSDPNGVRSALRDGSYESPVRQTSERASELGLNGTPTLVVGNRAVNPLQTEQTRTVLDDAVAAVAGGTATASAGPGTESG